MIGTAGHDFLDRDNAAFVETLRRLHVPHSARHYPSLPHGFFSTVSLTPVAERAADELCADFRAILHPDARGNDDEIPTILLGGRPPPRPISSLSTTPRATVSTPLDISCADGNASGADAAQTDGCPLDRPTRGPSSARRVIGCATWCKGGARVCVSPSRTGLNCSQLHRRDLRRVRFPSSARRAGTTGSQGVRSILEFEQSGRSGGPGTPFMARRPILLRSSTRRGGRCRTRRRRQPLAQLLDVVGVGPKAPAAMDASSGVANDAGEDVEHAPSSVPASSRSR